MGQLDDLIALREQLQEWMESAPVDRRAALVAQYLTTIDKIDKLTPKEPVGDAIDEISARRSARRSGAAAGKGRTKRSG